MNTLEAVKVLVVEDEEITRERMCHLLEKADHVVKSVADARTARSVHAKWHPEVVLVDLLLSDTSDFDLTRFLAEQGDCGVIIVSGMQERQWRLDGLRSGADDFLAKPYDPDELLLKVARLGERVRNARTPETSEEELRCGPWLFYVVERRCAHDDGQEVMLTENEARLLYLLLGAAGRVLSRDELREHVSQDAKDISDRAIDSCVSRLRKKLEENPGRPQWLQSVYGAGYRFGPQKR